MQEGVWEVDREGLKGLCPFVPEDGFTLVHPEHVSVATEEGCKHYFYLTPEARK